MKNRNGFEAEVIYDTFIFKDCPYVILAAAQTFAITAESRHPAPRPGAKIRIMFGDTELGEYVVTEAVHNLDNVNIYSCVFKALPADIEVMPLPANL